MFKNKSINNILTKQNTKPHWIFLSCRNRLNALRSNRMKRQKNFKILRILKTMYLAEDYFLSTPINSLQNISQFGKLWSSPWGVEISLLAGTLGNNKEKFSPVWVTCPNEGLDGRTGYSAYWVRLAWTLWPSVVPPPSEVLVARQAQSQESWYQLQGRWITRAEGPQCIRMSTSCRWNSYMWAFNLIC